MASSLYGKGRQKFLEGSIHWLTDDFKVVIVDTDDYTADIDVDEFLSDIPSDAREETSGNLENKTSTLGVADADDVVLTGTSGNLSEAVVIYKDTGDPATSPLVAYIDTASGLPVSLGGTVTVRWDAGANKIFKL